MTMTKDGVRCVCASTTNAHHRFSVVSQDEIQTSALFRAEPIDDCFTVDGGVAVDVHQGKPC